MLVIQRYSPSKASEWDTFVGVSRNGTFLFMREYMDYHADRFTDSSFMFYKNGKLRALLPANTDGETLYSHQGLTYGSLITDMSATTELVSDIFKNLNEYLQSIGIKRVVYKAIPWIYHKYPSEEDLYALFSVCNAHLASRHISSALYLPLRPRLSESRKSGLRKAISANLSTRELPVSRLSEFWEILTSNLEKKYHAEPVHTLEEMSLLASRFPSNIKLYGVFNDMEMLGGTIIYQTPQVVHTQYISASPAGKSTGALDILFDTLLQTNWRGANYFEFGKSSEGDGHILNAPLLFQKEGFGGRGIVYDWYEWTL